jgi:hypothetical protein
MSCSYCTRHLAHPYFLYLISTRACTGKWKTLIGSSRFPTERVKSQNLQKGYRRGSKPARSEAGNWALEAVLGGFDSDTLFQLKEEWKRLGRKDLRRQMWSAYRLALRYPNVCMYVEDMEFAKKCISSNDSNS